MNGTTAAGMPATANDFEIGTAVVGVGRAISTPSVSVRQDLSEVGSQLAVRRSLEYQPWLVFSRSTKTQLKARL